MTKQMFDLSRAAWKTGGTASASPGPRRAQPGPARRPKDEELDHDAIAQAARASRGKSRLPLLPGIGVAPQDPKAHGLVLDLVVAVFLQVLVGPQLGQTVNKAEVEGEQLDLLGREATENQPASQGAAPIRLAKLAEVAQVGDSRLISPSAPAPGREDPVVSELLGFRV